MQIKARKEYLCDKAAQTMIEIWAANGRYGEYIQKQMIGDRVVCGDFILRKKKEYLKLLGKIRMLGKTPKEGDITPAIIQRAKDYPFEELVEFKHRSAMCPFHEGKTPALRLYPGNNTVHCFACQKSWDTIAWVMESDGLTFPEAVKKLS